jgi:antitoxin ParD1/3/4
MNLSIGSRWESYIDSLLNTGRYGSASEIVREGLRLVEEREISLAALRDKLAQSIERGGENTAADARAAVTDTLNKRTDRKQRAA